LEQNKLGRALKCQVSAEQAGELRAEVALMMVESIDAESEVLKVDGEPARQRSEGLNLDLPQKGD
jgi:hypothetical protein